MSQHRHHGWARIDKSKSSLGLPLTYHPKYSICPIVRAEEMQMPKALDLTGQRHGRLIVLCRAEAPKSRNAMWKCRCDCGGTIIAAAANIGKTTFSCGCLQSEAATKTLSTNRLARRGLHGLSRRSEHGIWCHIKQRCGNPRNPKYPRYGGRGIKVCQRWSES